jgi:hypothetical protein
MTEYEPARGGDCGSGTIERYWPTRPRGSRGEGGSARSSSGALASVRPERSASRSDRGRPVTHGGSLGPSLSSTTPHGAGVATSAWASERYPRARNDPEPRKRNVKLSGLLTTVLGVGRGPRSPRPRSPRRAARSRARTYGSRRCRGTARRRGRFPRAGRASASRRPSTGRGRPSGGTVPRAAGEAYRAAGPAGSFGRERVGQEGVPLVPIRPLRSPRFFHSSSFPPAGPRREGLVRAPTEPVLRFRSRRPMARSRGRTAVGFGRAVLQPVGREDVGRGRTFDACSREPPVRRSARSRSTAAEVPYASGATPRLRR